MWLSFVVVGEPLQQQSSEQTQDHTRFHAEERIESSLSRRTATSWEHSAGLSQRSF
jgi:hypothetical protein